MKILFILMIVFRVIGGFSIKGEWSFLYQLAFVDFPGLLKAGQVLVRGRLVILHRHQIIIPMTEEKSIQGQGARTIKTKYDFIIVGAGSAGCVITRRLADNGASVSIKIIMRGTNVVYPLHWICNAVNVCICATGFQQQ
ncbi:hypothetical protein SAMN05192573_10773 [Mucilaginibacter gossypii]|uniref:Glucose-methanol-choline oxidoreductase N-terminal domain-containing protein n=2 Tax=Mucilaginibacter gossypii TaxID=551996 RepID=A0A1G8A2G9_9SPHI|nr:hypothetical protein SAMN05192573_10773 [Mucilaginibacter gossypii]